MNSKVLLENLEDNGRDYILPVRIYKQIKQDLEILEILKDIIMVDEDEKVVTLFLKNKEVVNKIKEWLYE